MDSLTWGVVVVAVLLGVAWYLSYSAARLDRLHTRAEGALSALDAQLVRRAEATLELANSGRPRPGQRADARGGGVGVPRGPQRARRRGRPPRRPELRRP